MGPDPRPRPSAAAHCFPFTIHVYKCFLGQRFTVCRAPIFSIQKFLLATPTTVKTDDDDVLCRLIATCMDEGLLTCIMAQTLVDRMYASRSLNWYSTLTFNKLLFYVELGVIGLSGWEGEAHCLGCVTVYTFAARLGCKVTGASIPPNANDANSPFPRFPSSFPFSSLPSSLPFPPLSLPNIPFPLSLLPLSPSFPFPCREAAP